MSSDKMHQNFRRVKCPTTGGFDRIGKTHVVYCGMWTCPHCAIENARKWAKTARAQVFSGLDGQNTRYWFLTLTLGSNFRHIEQGFEALPGLWDRLRKNMQRAYPDGWSYLAFVEGQPERGYMPHFHVLSSMLPTAKLGARGKITKHTLHDWAHRLGWGFEAELEPVLGDKAASYVAKYASKQSPRTPKGFRRVRPSQDWRRPPNNPIFRLLVPFRAETTVDFLNRVSEVTGLAQEDLFVLWRDLQREIALERVERAIV